MARRVISVIEWVLALFLAILAIRCAIVGFSGGHIPIMGNQVRGSAGHGFLWLFIGGSFAFGIFQVAALLIEALVGSPAPKQVTPSAQGVTTPKRRLPSA
jgi:hypothetical protein